VRGPYNRAPLPSTPGSLMMHTLKPAGALAVLLSCSILALLLAVSIGSVSLPLASVIGAVFHSDGDTASRIVTELRLPRALAAFGTGGSLALAGGLLQVLLRNPLADPYVLGVSGGAAVAALCAMLLGIASPWLPVSALGGALVSTALVFVLARGDGAWSPTRLLLTGVVLASGWGAVIALLLSVAPEAQLRGMLFWLIGDLSSAPVPWLPLVTLAAASLVVAAFARDLNALARGELSAAALGVSVRNVGWTMLAVAAVLTAVAVTTAGAIGFIGLIVPHLVRMLAGNDQRVLLPASALGGGVLLLLSDTAARQVIAPAQLPVGVVTALIGVPVFLYLLAKGR